jgi:hypothetical protein
MRSVSPAQIKVGMYNFTFALVRMSPRKPCRTWGYSQPENDREENREVVKGVHGEP